MPGVEILNTTIHYKYALPTWAIITVVAIPVIPVIIAIIGIIQSDDFLSMLGLILFLVGAVSAIFIGLTAEEPTDKIDYIEHEVLIDNSVSFTEFNEKYEIVKQKGQTYVIREKEVNNGKVNE